MKKIYSFACMAMVALASVAAPKMNAPLHIDSARANMRLVRPAAPVKLNAQDGMIKTDERGFTETRAFTGTDGITYRMFAEFSPTLQITNSSTGETSTINATWCDYMFEGDFKDTPYWVAAVYLQGYDSSMTYNGTYLLYEMFWPARCAAKDYDMSNAPAYPWVEDTDESWEFWGPISIEEMIDDSSIYSVFYMSTLTETGGIYPYSMDDNGNFNGWGMMDESMYYTYYDMTFSTYLGNDAYQSNDRGTNKIDFIEYLRDEDWMNADIAAYLKLKSSSSRNYKLLVPYQGVAGIYGFSNANYNIPCGQIHIFNTGQASSTDSDKAYWYEEMVWGPLTRLYMYMPSDLMEVVVPSSATDFATAHDANNIGINFIDTSDAVYDNYTYIAGYIYSEANLETLPSQHTWTLIEPKFTYDEDWEVDVVSFAPEADCIIPTTYDETTGNEYPFSAADATEIWLRGNAANLQPGSTFTIGTTNGAEFVGHNTSGDNYCFNTKSNIIYHPNPSNVQTTVEIASVGDITKVDELVAGGVEGVNVVANAGVLSVSVANATNVYVYSLAGQLVGSANVAAGESAQFAVDGGVYLVKAGDAVKKVVL
jgi:hypothetical protein